MPKFLVKLADDEYVEWSTVVDAPVSYVMTRDEAVAWRNGDEEAIQRADDNGHSALWMSAQSVDELVAFNRAGDHESCISLEEIREKYTYNKEES